MKASEKYKLMTRAERRVAIAKDVIRAVNTGMFGGILSFNGYVAGIPDEVETISSKNAKEVAAGCDVCARGALMMCRIAKFNGVELGVGRTFGIPWVDDLDTLVVLDDAFTARQLLRIEAAFEMYTPDGKFQDAFEFGEYFDNDEDRLVAIMQNIIDHKGTFKPEVEYVMK